MNKTGTICIGNSDDKLTQVEWAEFISLVKQLLENWQVQIHFNGYSLPTATWQNACWVFALEEEGPWLEDFKSELAYISRQFRQDSIALAIGETQFVGSEG